MPRGVRVQLELHARRVAERHDAHARLVTWHLQLADDLADEPEHLAEAFSADAAGRVEHEHQVDLATAVCRTMSGVHVMLLYVVVLKVRFWRFFYAVFLL